MLYNLKNITQKYANKVVLDIDALEIDDTSITAITGSNGSGKSTLLRILAFLEEPYSGALEISRAIKKQDISMLFAEPYLLRRSVRENLEYGAKMHNIQIDETTLYSVLESVGLLPKKFLKRYSNELSSGEAQRVALASRLIFKPKVLILDEPTKSLDVAGVSYFTHAILDAREQYKTKIIVCDHNLDWLNKLTDQFISLSNGKVSEYGSQNIITSEWQREDGSYITYLGKRNVVQSSQIPEKFRYAYIPPENIKISYVKTDSDNCLMGEVVGIRFKEKISELSVKVGSSIFVCFGDEDEIKNLQSSYRIWLSFSKEDIKFV